MHRFDRHVSCSFRLLLHSVAAHVRGEALVARFVDVCHITRWTAEGDLESILAGLVRYPEDDHRRWSDVELTPSVANPWHLGVIEHDDAIDLLANPANPKDHFSLVRAAAPVPARW